MKVGLFVPCYVDQFYPQVAIASLHLLEQMGCEVIVPLDQTCCGQPMANSGFQHFAGSCDRNIIEQFSGLDYIVCPSGSCTLHVRNHLQGEEPAIQKIRSGIYELTQFLTDVLQVKELPGRFPHRVGLHQSCHGQRGLHLSQMSERVEPPFSKPLQLLNMVDGLELVNLGRVDECCGFGGTFSVFEEAVSTKMGKDRVLDHWSHGAEYITGVDMSCLMHLEGIIRREQLPLQVKHIAEVLLGI